MAASKLPPSLVDYRAMVTIENCQWDGAKLPQAIDTYEHPYGWMVNQMHGPQWLSIRCPKCGYDWSLNKLGVPRGPR